MAQIAPTAVPPELTPLLQSMARDLASMGKEIEQLKAGRELMARDNANLSEQLRASQELTRGVARLSEQLKTSQEQVARDNANVAEQIKAIQDQLARVISQASEQNAPPRIAAAPPRPAAPVARKPVPILLSPLATAQPKAEKTKIVIDLAAAGARALAVCLHSLLFHKQSMPSLHRGVRGSLGCRAWKNGGVFGFRSESQCKRNPKTEVHSPYGESDSTRASTADFGRKYI